MKLYDIRLCASVQPLTKCDLIKTFRIKMGSAISAGGNLKLFGPSFYFKLGSLTDNTINPLNANSHF